MSIELMSKAFKAQIPSTQKLVLLALSNYASEDGSCWVGCKKIMELTSLSERSVRAATKWLRDNGYIFVQNRFIDNRQTTNLWTVNEAAFGATGAPSGASREPSKVFLVHSDNHKEDTSGYPPKAKIEREDVTELPRDFKPTAKQEEFAREQGLDINECLNDMKRWAIGKKRARWGSVFNQFLKPNRFGSNLMKAQKARPFTPLASIDLSPVDLGD